MKDKNNFLLGEIYGIRIALNEKNKNELSQYLSELEKKYEETVQNHREADG